MTSSSSQYPILRRKYHDSSAIIIGQRQLKRIQMTGLVSLLILMEMIGSFSILSSSKMLVNASIDVDGNAFGYVASTDVSMYLKLAYDIRDMRLANDDFTKKKTIYVNGTNAPGMSLQKLSFDAATLYTQTPMFQIYQDSFDSLGQQMESDNLGEFDGKPIGEFSDTIVIDLFKLNIQYIEATGSLVHNVVQAYLGHLWLVLNACKANDVDAMNAALDIAVALYVGSDQIRNENNKGYMLYNLAENAATFFNQDSGESVVNGLTLDKFLQLQVAVNDDTCASSGGYITVRKMIKSLYRYTNIFLTQWLLYYVQQYNDPDYGNGCDFIELFGLALWPQIHTCNTTLANHILDRAIVADVTEKTMADTITSYQEAFTCLGITCIDVGSDGSITQCKDDANALQPLAKYYTPYVDVRDISHLDQDMNNIAIFMKRTANDVATDFYQNGWHSTLYSLQDIATNSLSWSASDFGDMLSQYYPNASSLDTVVTNLLSSTVEPNGAPVFATTNTIQKQTIVTGLLQGTVMYLGVLGNLESSINACGENGKITDIRRLWDSAVALFVGSMVSTDGTTNTGLSMYNMVTKYCAVFKTCTDNSKDSNPYVVLSTFKAAIIELNDMKCDEAYSLLENILKPAMFISLVQGYLSNIMSFVDTLFSTSNSAAVDEALAYTYAYSYTIRPILDEVDDTLSEQIRANTPFMADVDTINATEAFEGIRNAIRLMQFVNCTDVGTYTYNGEEYGLCPNDKPLPDLTYEMTLQNQPSAPSASAPITPSPTVVRDDSTSQNTEGIAWGRYTFVDKDNAIIFANFANDIKGLYYADTLDEAEGNYTKSSSNVTVGNNIVIQSLQDFSIKAYQFMSSDPIYNFFRLALFEDGTFDDPTNGDGEDYWAFMNAIERLAIGKENGNSSPLAAETVIVLGMWHMIANMLYETARQCTNKVNKPALVDYAIALWIGQGQDEAKYNSGWSMYYVAQQAAKNYGFDEGEALINQQLMDDFNAAQKLADTCSTDPDAGTRMRILVDDMLKKLSIPLAQNLMYHMSVNNFQYVELYALSVIPQGISCDLGAFEYLRDSLFQGYSKDGSLDNSLIHKLGNIFNCLRFQCDDFATGPNESTAATANNTTELQSLTASLCDELDFDASAQKLSSYSLTSEGNTVTELSRLDLDVLQAELFARAGEYNLSYNIYQNGRNSLDGKGGYNTLRGLVTATKIKDDVWYNQTVDYYGTSYHADATISGALFQSASATFQGASRRQRAEIVLRALQTSVTAMAAVDRLYQAVSICESGSDGESLVDEAAALYIGSIEGSDDGGNEDNSGKLMFALAKEFCDEFNKCQNHVDAKSNQLVLVVLQQFRNSIKSKDCNNAKDQLEETILNQMQIPLIQALLYHADVNEGLLGSSLIESIAGGSVIADTILPMIKAANATSVNTISTSMEFTIANSTVPDDRKAVFEAVTGALKEMNVDCNSVGTYVSEMMSVCPANITNAQAPLPNTTTNLGNDLYTSTTYVQDRADIAKDIEEMTTSLEDGRQDMAQLIYREGKNSAIYDSSGKRVDLRSLQSFSTTAQEKMKNNPLYQIAVFALRDAKKLFNGTDAYNYADTVVQLAFVRGRENREPLAAEAAVALNLWMEVANELFNTVSSCKDGQLTDDAGIQSIDEAAAYWIGDGQIAGSAERGHLLYALAEEMGDNFGMATGESRTNKNILNFFHEAKILLSQTNACKQADTARRVRHLVDKIVSSMIVVQMQALIHYLRTGDKDRVFIYAHSFVPLVSACRPSTFEYLKAQLLDSTFQESEIDKIVAAIRSTLPCFGLSCDDLGVHKTESDGLCTDPTPLTPLAGYKPSVDVTELSKIDLDILELDILMQMEAYDAAADLYSFGKHASVGTSGTSLSLQSLATSSGRSVAPQYASFKQYYSNTDRFADNMIQTGFDLTTKLGVIQRRALVSDTSKYIIMQLAVLKSLYDAVGACVTGAAEKATATKNWDEAAAYMIGSLEGANETGTDDGELFFHISKRYCQEFGTCSTEVPGSSLDNDQIRTLLYAGNGAISSGNCDELRKAAHGLSTKLVIPLIQGSLSAAVKLTTYTTSSSEKALVQAEANVYSQALLPLIHDSNRRAADVISKNFPLQGPAMLDGRRTVVTAFSSVLQDLAVDCVYIGISSEVNACTGESQSEMSAGGIVGIVIASVALVGLIVMLIRLRRRKGARGSKPMFLEPNGEFNHNADLLIVKTDLSERGRSGGGDAETDCLNYADADVSTPDDDYVNAISRALDERDDIRGEEQAPKINQVV